MSERVAPTPTASPVSVHIDVVSVQGLALTPAQAAHFKTAFEEELARLASRGIGSTSLEPGPHSAVLAPSLQLGHTVQAAELGRQVGRRVWAALDRAGYPSRVRDS